MLVFTRREGERIQIGENVCITVVRVEGGGVRIGIEAPQPMTIVRGEVFSKEGPARRAGPLLSEHPQS